MIPSVNCIIVTKWAEGLKLTAYPDPGSRDGKPWTIGHGHTKGVKKGDTCTAGVAGAWLRDDLHAAAEIVRRLVKVELTQAQFDAVCDFVFNIGESQFKASTLLKNLNGRQWAAARGQFPRWKYNDGKEMRGLRRRRAACVALWDGKTGDEAVAIGEATA